MGSIMGARVGVGAGACVSGRGSVRERAWAHAPAHVDMVGRVCVRACVRVLT